MSQYSAYANYEGDEKFLEDLNAPNRIGSDILRYRYNFAKYNFAGEMYALLAKKKIVTDGGILALGHLEDLHTIVNRELKAIDNADSQINAVSHAFYETDDAFRRQYLDFVKSEIVPLFKEPIYVQATPTIRFHFPNQDGFTFKPTYHSDIMLGHPPASVNVWVPFTKVYGTNGISILSKFDSEHFFSECNNDFRRFAGWVQEDDSIYHELDLLADPMILDPGQFLIFDPRCIHATLNNQEKTTRISMDFRVIAVSDFEKMNRQYVGTGRKRMPFCPGQYYAADAVSGVVDARESAA